MKSPVTFIVLALSLPLTLAFAPRPTLVSKTRAITPASTHPLQLAPTPILPEHVDALTTAMDQVQHHLSSSTLLADAADAAVDATKDPGWWAKYLSLFKATLSFVHETIDEPLRDAGWTQTWGVSIFLFTAGIRSLLIPISVQQTKSAEYTKALKPYMQEIKEKFKDDKDSQNRAIAKLYEDADQNPLSGCLLSLVQLPVLLGLYRGIRLLAQEGKLQEPFLWIPSLEGPVSAPDFRGMDWLTSGWTPGIDGGLPTPQLGWETTLAFLIMPVILVFGQSITMSVLSPPMDDETGMSEEEAENMKKTQGFLKFLPLMIGYFSLQVPAGLTIYWFTSNLFSLTQSLVVKGYYAANPPKIELPEYWDSLDNLEEMSPDEKRQAAEAGINAGPKFSDLVEEANFHYIVKRDPLRADSEAWKSLDAAGGKGPIPAELQEWVAASSAPPAHSASETSAETSKAAA